MTALAARRAVGPIARVLAGLGAGVSALCSGPAHGTGMPILDAGSDFQRARRAYLAARLVRSLTPGRRGRSHPRALDGVAALSWHAPRLRVIPLRAVVGTVDATNDFDARFRPAAPRLAARWQRVALAHRQARPLPPISVIQRPEGYYAIDGRHRVSVARALRHRDIEAWVSPGQPPGRIGYYRAMLGATSPDPAQSAEAAAGPGVAPQPTRSCNGPVIRPTGSRLLAGRPQRSTPGT